MISLFLKIYQQNKNLCSKLIDIFNKKNYEENTDRDKDLAIELNTFNNIYSNANSLIEENKYDASFLWNYILLFMFL